MSNNVIVSKFGSIALSTAEMVRKTAEIIMSDPSRRYVVASAPGARHAEDVKITDMLFILNSRYENRENFNEMLKRVRDRFAEIIQGLGINFDIDAEIAVVKKNLFFGKGNDFIVSRGEMVT